jgi:hypothetical protein
MSVASRDMLYLFRHHTNNLTVRRSSSPAGVAHALTVLLLTRFSQGL